MMLSKKQIPIVLVAAMSATSLFAAEARPRDGKARAAVVKAYDANGDGKLDRKEEAAILKKFDANSDGKLDKVEKKAVARSVAPKTAARRSAALAEGSTPRKYDRAYNVSYAPKYTMKDWVAVERTTEQIALVEESVAKSETDSWRLKFYRNRAYKCGLSGHYTFVVIEPKNAPGGKAPLWVYFHGGGGGYFNKEGVYITLKFQNKDTYNHEESFETLRRVNNGRPVFDDGRFVNDDTTLTRRVKEGYRLLVIGYGDHDQYSGKGTPYPNNPKGGEVNGLQASMAAVEYTVANHPTTHVFAHGTSAGSAGAYSLGFAFAQDGIDLTGVVMDSSVVTPRRTPVILAMAANDSKIAPEVAVEIMERESKTTWWGAPRGKIEKVGVMSDPEYPFYPEAAVKAGYRSVPMLIIAGTRDPFFGGKAPVVAEAKAAGMGNVEWMWDGLRQAIDGQKNSPHELLLLEGTGHVPTAKKDGHRVHDDVDAFIRRAVSSRASFPFAKDQEVR